MRAEKVKEFELIDHGIEHSQYFQGYGVAFTRFGGTKKVLNDEL